MSFRTSLLISAAAAVMVSGTAFAADLPSRTMAPATPYVPRAAGLHLDRLLRRRECGRGLRQRQ